MKNKYLTERERYQIEILYKEKYSVSMIAERLGRCKATIYNELSRGMVTLLDDEFRDITTYDAYYAHQKSISNSKEKGRPLKIGNDLEFIKHIENKMLLDKYSPCAVIADLISSGITPKTCICFKTLYNYIHSGIFLHFNEKNMIYKVFRNKKKENLKSKVSLHNLKGQSIENRPRSINSREEYGHWEMDTVYSGHDKGKSCLLVLTERKCRDEIVRKMPDRTVASVVRTLNKLELDFGYHGFRDTFKTITCDNGSEFLNHSLLESSVYGGIRTIIYYCHPYASSERGSNENANKLIRRFIPKGCGIDAFTNEAVRHIEEWINNYPRKIFDYLSSNEYRSFCGL